MSSVDRVSWRVVGMLTGLAGGRFGVVAGYQLVCWLGWGSPAGCSPAARAA